MNPEELLQLCGDELQAAKSMLILEEWTDGTHPQTVHRVNVAKVKALLAIGLALKAIAEKGAS